MENLCHSSYQISKFFFKKGIITEKSRGKKWNYILKTDYEKMHQPVNRRHIQIMKFAFQTLGFPRFEMLPDVSLGLTGQVSFPKPIPYPQEDFTGL